MPTSSGPRNTAKSNLVFALDTYDTSNCVTPLGCGGWNNSTQGIKDILTGVAALYQNGLRISNRTFYTAFGISYPEGSYGGDAAGCQGLSSGYNVRTYGNVYGASRSLHLWVWDNNTNTWVPDSYFRGLRLGGHCYDNYAGAEIGWQNELNYFNGDFNIIKQAFPNSTWIICGSHACQMFDSTTIDNMVSLGAPRSTISSWTDGSQWREFVLVGRPGLGDNNAYGWAYENYSTNPGQVAHMNLSVTPRNIGVLEFDGTNDYISMPSSNVFDVDEVTVEVIVKPNGLSQLGFWFEKGTVNTQYSLFMEGSSIVWRQAVNSQYTATSTMTNNAWNHVVGTFRSGQRITYVNGTARTSDSLVYTLNKNQGDQYIGSYNSGGYFYNGAIAVINVYNRALSSVEIQNNYRQYKTRFNLP